MTDDHRRLDCLLAEIRDSHPDMVWLYTEGQCYALWRIVRAVFPSAECLYSQREGHVYIRLHGRVYDIHGRWYQVPDDLGPLDHQRGHKPHRWGQGDRRRLVGPHALKAIERARWSGVAYTEVEPRRGPRPGY